MYRHNQCIATSSARAIFQALGTSSGRDAAALLERGEFADLLSLHADPLAYETADVFRDDYLVAELMSKFPNFDIGIDRESVAFDKFRDSERVCSEANHRLKFSYGMASTTISVASCLYTAQRKIARLLGPFSWDEAERHFGFGPGSTTSLKRVRGDAYYKFGAFRPHVTRECMALGFAAICREPRWLAHLAGLTGEVSPDTYNELLDRVRPADILHVVKGNHVITVPKNAKTDRVIAKEPDLNMYVQRGIGGCLRRRLKRVGVNLDDQRRNQFLARQGSMSGRLATLDLSSASDTVCLELVRLLLPPDWFSAIETCRSPQGILPNGEVLTYQKVSSMGNGFTFEVESLIFWALVSAIVDLHEVIDRRIAVYGDDLIFSVDCMSQVVELLSICGFTANTKKSFHTGKFRESCGKHYFDGCDVTPFYIRESVESPERLIWLANSIRRHARKGMPWGLDGRFEEVHQSVVRRLPKFWQTPRIPDVLGDIALIGDFDEVRPKKAPRGWAGWMGCGVVRKHHTFLPDDDPFLIKVLYEKGRNPPISRDSISGVVVGGDSPLGVSKPMRRVSWQVVRPVTELWESFGPWIEISTASK